MSDNERPSFPNVSGARVLSDSDKERVADAAWKQSNGNRSAYQQLCAEHVRGEIDLFSENPTSIRISDRTVGVGSDRFTATGGETHDLSGPASAGLAGPGPVSVAGGGTIAPAGTVANPGSIAPAGTVANAGGTAGERGTAA